MLPATLILALYAFAVQFNRMFLVYCAILGLSSYLLAAIALGLTRSAAPLRYRPRAPVRLAGTFLIAIAVVFAAAWLGETIPAILHGDVPRTVAQAGLVPTRSTSSSASSCPPRSPP